MPMLRLTAAGFHHLCNRVPSASSQIFAKRLLNQAHEDRSLWAWDVRAENLGSLDAQNTSAIQLDRQFDPCLRLCVQQRDDTLEVRRKPERFVGVRSHE